MEQEETAKTDSNKSLEHEKTNSHEDTNKCLENETEIRETIDKPSEIKTNLINVNDECNSSTNTIDSDKQPDETKVTTETKEDAIKKNEESPESKEQKESSENDQYAEHITYKEDGTAIYTDPKTSQKYSFSNETNKWEPLEENNPYENEHYKWCFETNQWIPKQEQKNVEYSFEDGAHTYKDQDGTTFFFDETKKAWFPKIDDDFMAIYQLNYGFDKDGNQNRKIVDDDGFKIPMSIKENMAEKVVEKEKLEQEQLTALTLTDPAAGKKRKAPPEPPKWFDINPEQNTKVYVSNLPLDITEQEFIDLMGKCGLIMKDHNTQKFKIKIYTDPNGMIKGDGLCDYIKIESVDLALKILDGYDVRGKIIKVEKAKFQMRGEYNPTLKPKKKKKDKEKIAKLKEKLLDWRPEKMRGERGKHERVVILKNLFDPEMFDEKVELILEYQNDLREECKKCGYVKKVIVYDRHPDGIASISMSCPEEADMVVQMMNRRFYGKRRLVAEIWDGKTKYKIEESAVEAHNRISKWEKHLEDEENARKESKNSKNDENKNTLINESIQIDEKNKKEIEIKEKNNISEEFLIVPTELKDQNEENSSKNVDIKEVQLNLDDEINSKEELEDEINSQEELEHEINSKEELEDKINSKEELEDEINSKEELEDKINSKEEVEDEIHSKEELEDEINSKEKLADEIDSKKEN